MKIIENLVQWQIICFLVHLDIILSYQRRILRNQAASFWRSSRCKQLQLEHFFPNVPLVFRDTSVMMLSNVLILMRMPPIFSIVRRNLKELICHFTPLIYLCITLCVLIIPKKEFDKKIAKRSCCFELRGACKSRDSSLLGHNSRSYDRSFGNFENKQEKIGFCSNSKKRVNLKNFHKTMGQVFKLNRNKGKRRLSYMKVKGRRIRVRDMKDTKNRKKRAKINSTCIQRSNFNRSMLFTNQAVQDILSRKQPSYPQSRRKENTTDLIHCSYNNYLSGNLQQDSVKNYKKTIFRRVKKFSP
ncbi:unnamed protein product [Moneuplotes crassus]|uniref:Uncharacterized protein n=1 Tax=Euplotes crassus TaxID=5936 RepID=A0AAD1UMN7_EUPCR|nr:unnamed protein product [Moneuplotes crassus]